MNILEPSRVKHPNDPDQKTWARLANYVKYTALVKYQEEALAQDDLDRFEDLAEARTAIQMELGQDPSPLPELDSLDPGTRECFERAYKSFREALGRDARLQARLEELKKTTAGELEEINGRDPQVKEYLERDEIPTGDKRSRLNVRL